MRRSEMMETKVWTVLCALLLLTVNLGSTEDGNDQAAASQSAPGAEVFTGAPAADSAPAPGQEPTSHLAPPLTVSDTNTSSSGTGSLNSNTTKGEEITTLAPEPEEKNDTNIAVPAVPEKSSNQTDDLSLLSTPSESQTTTSQVTTASTSQTTPTSPPHVPHDTPVDTTITHSSIDPTSLPPDSISTSKQPAEPKIHPTTPAPTPEPSKPETTITTTTTTATSTQSKSTPSPSSSQESPNIESLTPTSPSQSHTTRGQTKSTTTPSSSSTPQTKAHADTPSQLNVGGDTMMVHESPTLDPLLAGLVTAFIVTAVVITLLLFLKLRRRDNRPEFRRLQDLPMDDMMEDTPLSMYSY